MNAAWPIKRGRVVAAAIGVLSAWACTVADKGEYTFTDNPGAGGSSAAGKGTGGTATAGKGGTSGEAGMTETGGTSGLGGRGGRGSLLGGRGGKAGTGGGVSESGAAGEAGEGGAAAAGGTGGTGGNAGAAGESGAGGEAGMAPATVCGDGHLDAGEQCDLGTNNGVTACAYGKTSCTVCTTSCTRTAGTVAYCGDHKVQASHEQCDDGNTVTEGCTYGDSTCSTCDSTCQRSSPRVCGDSTVDGDTLVSMQVDTVGVWPYLCPPNGLGGPPLPLYLNGVPLANVAESLCACASSVSSTVISDSAVLAAVRPTGNVLEIQPYNAMTQATIVAWVKLTFNFADGSTAVVAPFDDGQVSTSGVNLCDTTTRKQAYARSAPFAVPRVEECDGDASCMSCGYPLVVSGFTGELGPVFPDWTQCAGYLDTQANTAEIPTHWGAACKVTGYDELLLACGDSVAHYRYIVVNKNLLRDGIPPNSGPYTDEIVNVVTAAYDQSGVAFTATENDAWASNPTDPDSSTTWWFTGDGCGETLPNLTIKNGCMWEVANCFGQNLTGDRHLWVYMKK